eukprot:3959563-Pleurochrysis_carterae.AAC.2
MVQTRRRGGGFEVQQSESGDLAALLAGEAEGAQRCIFAATATLPLVQRLACKPAPAMKVRVQTGI